MLDLGSTALRYAFFGQGTGPIVLNNFVQCTGSETRLLDCPLGSRISSCQHYYDVGVRCLAQTGCSQNYSLELYV